MFFLVYLETKTKNDVYYGCLVYMAYYSLRFFLA